MSQVKSVYWTGIGSRETPASVLNDMEQYAIEIARSRTDLTFHLPMPGVGNGHLNVQQVWEVIKCLPDNVYIYQNTGA
ncbi:hypothetical protein [Vibrio phage JSF7]|uniref:Uncharacterized protein n=1 Tax=Vibrio phage JSF7 TaxID=1292086 RepID=A0A240EWU7_9CAUD|nr:hypothetical protein HOQ92_gp14 [Vibrio phage JSF7]APD18138.1 hypothetical protein [Vibrio phage JSF7]